MLEKQLNVFIIYTKFQNFVYIWLWLLTAEQRLFQRLILVLVGNLLTMFVFTKDQFLNCYCLLSYEISHKNYKI